MVTNTMISVQNVGSERARVVGNNIAVTLAPGDEIHLTPAQAEGLIAVDDIKITEVCV